MKIVSTELSKSGSGKILKRLLRERFYFEVYVVARELRRKNKSNSSATLVEFFLYFRAQKDSNKTATKGGSLRR
jgi:hypothetical protein